MRTGEQAPPRRTRGSREDPERALRRLRVNAASAMLGAYTGARSDKRSLFGWVTPTGDADSATLNDRPALVARTRDLARNHPIAGGAISHVTLDAIGSGLAPRPSVDREVLRLDDEPAEEWERAAAREFALAADTPDLDAARTLGFGAMQALALRSTLEGGDCFLLRLFMERAGRPYATTLQLLEGERIANPPGKAESIDLAGGVEVDRTTGAPVAYHIAPPASILPGADASKWSRLPAFGKDSGLRNVLHLYRPLRPGQRRGVPFLAPVIDCLRQLGQYSDAELMAAVINSCFAIGSETKSGAGFAGLETSETTSGGQPINIVESGQIFDLGEGEKIQSFTPGRPSASFEPFYLAIIKLIGVGLDIPYEVLLRHFSASYSASRAALEMAWRSTLGWRAFMAASCCQPVYEFILTEAVARGRLNAPGFFADPLLRRAWLRCDWIGPAKPQIDETKEVEAARQRVELGISTLTKEAAARGDDWEQLHPIRAKEQRMRRDDGLVPTAPAPLAPAARPQAPFPAPAPAEDVTT